MRVAVEHDAGGIAIEGLFQPARSEERIDLVGLAADRVDHGSVMQEHEPAERPQPSDPFVQWRSPTAATRKEPFMGAQGSNGRATAVVAVDAAGCDGAIRKFLQRPCNNRPDYQAVVAPGRRIQTLSGSK